MSTLSDSTESVPVMQEDNQRVPTSLPSTRVGACVHFPHDGQRSNARSSRNQLA